jgi:hypothetical protein
MKTFSYEKDPGEVHINLYAENGYHMLKLDFPTQGDAEALFESEFSKYLSALNYPQLTPEEIASCRLMLENNR